MSERTDTLKLAHKILDRVNADPDDDLAMLSRQLLRGQEVIDKLKRDLEERMDPHLDLVHANRDTILRVHEEALRRIKQCLDRKDYQTIYTVLNAVNTFHPMHGESWSGFPKESD